MSDRVPRFEAALSLGGAGLPADAGAYLSTEAGSGRSRQAVPAQAVPAQAVPGAPPTGRVALDGCDVLALLVGSAGPDLEQAARIAGVTPTWLAERCFSGKPGDILMVPAGLGTVALVGVGDAADHGFDRWRSAGACLARSVRQVRAVAVELSGDDVVSDNQPDTDLECISQAFAEGMILGAYRFEGYRSQPSKPSVERVVFRAAETALVAIGRGMQQGVRISRAVCLARDLVNEPASVMTPQRLAAAAVEAAAHRPALSVTVWDEKRIAAERLGGLLGVARGSVEPARLIRMEYKPSGEYGRSEEPEGSGEHGRSEEHEPGERGPRAAAQPPGKGRRPMRVALVGKGITFDSGGLSLKSPEGMVTMKTDMSGAAAVIATMTALADCEVPVRVVGIVVATENLPGSRATKPGDVLTARNGKTIEVLNTDAEGRLVLADGLSLAAEESADAIIDLATLTGACVTALGPEIAGCFANADWLAGALMEAGERSGEPLWRLPLPASYRRHIDSDVADMKNVGLPGGKGGAIAGAMLLKEFVGDHAWAHLDIAGPARSDRDEGIFEKGATGFGVRLLTQALSSLARAQPNVP